MIEKFKQLLPNLKNKKFRKSTLYGGLAVFLLFIALLQVPSMLQTKQLRELGYSISEIKEIRSQKLTNVILKNDYYSPNLAQAILTKTLNKDYLELYVVTEKCEKDDFLLYDRLIDKGYSDENVITLFSKLKFYEITPLLVFDFQENIQPYIEDVVANSSTNSSANFQLTNSYVTLYESLEPVENVGNYDMLVNKHFFLPSSFAPATVAEISVRYASSGVTLDAGATEGLKALCEGGRDLGLVIYAASGYRTYDHQNELYDRYVSAYGKEEADRFSARPGHSEHQTGLAVDLAAGGESQNIASFADTLEFSWVIDNAASYGWILRYPEGKESITGYDYEPWHYRYVGVELAQKIVSSGLTYDEYYLLYIAPFNETAIEN